MKIKKYIIKIKKVYIILKTKKVDIYINKNICLKNRDLNYIKYKYN